MRHSLVQKYNVPGPRYTSYPTVPYKKGEIPIYRGHFLTTEDEVVRNHILNLMCKLETSWTSGEGSFSELPDVLVRLKEMEADGFLEMNSDSLR